MSCRLKNEAKVIREQVFKQEDYIVSQVDEETGEVRFKYKIISGHEVNYKNETGKVHQLSDQIVITWSAKRAAKDKQKRERLRNGE